MAKRSSSLLTSPLSLLIPRGDAFLYLFALLSIFSLLLHHLTPATAKPDFEGFDADEDEDFSIGEPKSDEFITPLRSSPPPISLSTHTPESHHGPPQTDESQIQSPPSDQNPKPASTSAFEYWDEDEFEGIPPSEVVTESVAAAAESDPVPSSEDLVKDQKSDVKFPRKITSFSVEIACVSFLIVFAINYFTGKKENENLALAWASKFATKDSIFEKNFSLLGVGETEDSPLLLQEGKNVFKFYASGRRYCSGLLATMELKSRHDLISRLYNMVIPCKDEITFEASLHLNLLYHLRRCKPLYASRAPLLRLISFRSKPTKLAHTRLLSTTATPYPLQYEMIISRPANSPHRQPGRRRSPAAASAQPRPDAEMGFNEWVDKKLSSKESDTTSAELAMDKSKRKYYNKRRKRMYGESESDEEGGRRRDESDFIELKQEVVELRTLHKREEELYFYDTFAYPWEKNKHYKMVYQMEKKYFPDQCFDKAFLEPGKAKAKQEKREARSEDVKEKGEEDKGLVFFEEREGESKDVEVKGGDVTEKKVEDFFKCLKKVPNEKGGAPAPFLSSRSIGLPPKWDGPSGTVVLVNKPKGWTSFTVCGKLRRLVNVKKVGHAGTLDPMATGLLIVCVGKATKVVDSYQGMMKGYSGVFRLGEATSTWDADSPVIQRESWEHVKDDDIKKAAASFCGEIWQVPPMFSAIKVGGERMYEKARRGESIELSPRRISIFQFDVERSLEDRQNVVFRVTCSKGTYIRSLCADFGKALGSCAHLTALRRDSIGEYSADDAWEFKELEEQINKGYI